MKLMSVVGARPNFMKIAPFIRAVKEHNLHATPAVEHILVHTGQHYDARMSDTFFTELGIPEPDINLEIGSGTHAEQVGHTMIAFEKVLKEHKPDWVIVVGDVNATLACSVTAKKEGIKCCHIEAGLRSGDMNMPEEINRLVTDRLSDLLLTPDMISAENLKKEGVPDHRSVFVGNIMIDTLEYNRKSAEALDRPAILLDNALDGQTAKLSVFNAIQHYGLITMHRPSNVDDKHIFSAFCNWIIQEASQEVPLIWPIHPRTVKQAEGFGLLKDLMDCPHILLLHPLGYLNMLHLNMHARLMLTDSGGLQEECCVLGTPFLTLRHNTERPVTLIEHGGAGYLVGNAIGDVKREFKRLLSENRNPQRPPLWDGQTAPRCLQAILHFKA
jgi:UDP-N-acetylglucosamine 2-epimerase (non-hydrolysing)